jgi:hypothetical protein
MHLLPKANPLKEHLQATKAVVSTVLQKLASEDFTGYMNLKAPGYDAFCIFALGNMVSVVSIEHSAHITGFDAFEHMLDKVFTSDAKINIYRMTPDLVMCSHALLQGEKIYSDEVIRQIDMKAIFADLKNRGLNGVVRFTADDRLAMLFFKNGTPIGFYTSGSQNIEASPEESRKIAAMPGAKLDVFSINPQTDIIPYDLLHMFDIDSICENLSKKHAVPPPTTTTAAPTPEPITTASAPEPAAENPVAEPVTSAQTDAPAEIDPSSLFAPPDSNELVKLIEDLQDVAVAYLSKSGKTVVERLIENAGGPSIFHHQDETDRFLSMLFMESMKIDDHARIEEMIDLMRSEIVARAQTH